MNTAQLLTPRTKSGTTSANFQRTLRICRRTGLPSCERDTSTQLGSWDPTRAWSRDALGTAATAPRPDTGVRAPGWGFRVSARGSRLSTMTISPAGRKAESLVLVAAHRDVRAAHNACPSSLRGCWLIRPRIFLYPKMLDNRDIIVMMSR